MKNKLKPSIVLTALLIFITMTVTVFGAEESKTAFVTISDENGKTVLALEPITLKDTDGDGKITLNDVLYEAHEEKYEGGAEAGYKSAETEFGISLVKLWGCENGGSYSYYVNNTSSFGLTDEISNGDIINAFIYTDTVGFTDTYVFFETSFTEAVSGENIVLSVYKSGYDEEWNPITLPCADAEITVDSIPVGIFTDKDGKAEIKIDGHRKTHYKCKVGNRKSCTARMHCKYFRCGNNN